jgi:hypothetical protein
MGTPWGGPPSPPSGGRGGIPCWQALEPPPPEAARRVATGAHAGGALSWRACPRRTRGAVRAMENWHRGTREASIFPVTKYIPIYYSPVRHVLEKKKTFNLHV